MTCFTGPLAMGCETFCPRAAAIGAAKAELPCRPRHCRRFAVPLFWGRRRRRGRRGIRAELRCRRIDQAGAELAKMRKVRRRIAAVYLRARHFQGDRPGWRWGVTQSTGICCGAPPPADRGQRLACCPAAQSVTAGSQLGAAQAARNHRRPVAGAGQGGMTRPSAAPHCSSR